jgi:hypothetical protein
MAERGPERLLGRRDTQSLDSLGIQHRIASSMSGVPRTQMNYGGIGAELAGMRTVAQTINTRNGDTFNYQGVAPDNLIRRWNEDQKRKSLLRGIAGLVK